MLFVDIEEDVVGSEDIVFSGTRDLNSPLSILLAGITYVNKDYQIFHPLDSAYAFEYVEEGKGYLVYDGKEYPVQEGDFYLIKSNTECYYYSDEATPFKKIWFNCTGSLINNLLEVYNLTEPIIIKQRNFLRYFENIFEIIENNGVTSDVHLIIHNMILDIVSYDDSRASKLVEEKIYEYINENYRKPLDLNSLADKLYISRAHLIHLFTKKYNMSPYKFYTNRKMDRAKELLSYTNMQIKEIANELSFSDSQHFSSSFKRNVGVSPVAYRQANSAAKNIKKSKI